MPAMSDVVIIVKVGHTVLPRLKGAIIKAEYS